MKKIVYCVSLLLILLFGGSHAYGEGHGANFSVAPVLPDNQIEDVSYFSVSPLSNKIQRIEVSVNNDSSKDITVKCKVADATTNDNGMPNYQQTDKKRDSSLVLGFSDIAHVVDPTVTVKAGESKKVTVEIKYPDKIEGTLLGGLTFEEVPGINSQKAGVTNRYLYSIAVKINGIKVVENKPLKLREVMPEQRNYRNYIEANLQNPSHDIINSLNLKAVVTHLRSGTTYKSKSTNLKMVPNSNFNYGISLGETPLKPGKYRFEISGFADGKSFSFQKSFYISTKVAKQNNKNAIISKNDNPFTRHSFIILLVVVITINISIGMKIWFKRKK
ncbi:DUF916 and DUF3324 domain-containing protein [Lactococcus lactis]|uniref:DUF916 and DUF3324 domain-containing protein n=1 Tax=Lactococcus lactis TaxID=1358 RepID=UPI0024160CEB|nr:DUF916 and DUF3324 domain-containing protein [Lactococcus lactis]MDG4974931.1 DUF916 and DUF3324 domain-containing protein [Lactococcus lactis]